MAYDEQIERLMEEIADLRRLVAVLQEQIDQYRFKPAPLTRSSNDGEDDGA